MRRATPEAPPVSEHFARVELRGVIVSTPIMNRDRDRRAALFVDLDVAGEKVTCRAYESTAITALSALAEGAELHAVGHIGPGGKIVLDEVIEVRR